MNDLINTTLNNNLKIVYINDNSLNHVSFILKTKAGSNYENKSNIGVAHLTEHLMVNKHKNMLYDYGASLNAYTQRDTSTIQVKILSEYILVALEYIITTILDNNFSELQIENQKNIILKEIDYYKSNVSKILLQKSYKNMFPNTRMTIDNIGTKKDVQKLTIYDVLNFKKSHYTADNMVLGIYGNLNNFSLENIINRYLSFIKRKKVVLNPEINHFKKGYNNFNLNNNKNFNIKIDYYAGKLGDTNNSAIKILNYILNNHLNSTIRDNQSKVYQINSQCYFSQNFGVMSIMSNTNDKNILKNINKQIANLNLHNLYTAKINLVSNKVFELENNNKILDFYTNQNFLEKPIDIKQDIQNIKDITINQLSDAYKNIFTQNPVISVV